MADITVRKIMETLVPGLRDLKKSKLYTVEELRKLASTIKKQEEKMVGGEKPLETFKAAIRYYDSALKDLIQRKNLKSLPATNTYLNWIFIKRVINAYVKGLKHFPSDFDFNMQYFAFLRTLPECVHMVTEHIKTMLQVFSHKPQIFTIAASWFHGRNRPDSSKNILLLGLALHPNCLSFYLDLIDHELKNHTQKGIEVRLMKYVNDIIKNNIPHTFVIEIIKIFDNYELPEVSDFTIEQLLSKFSDEEDVWHFVATRELKGDYCAPGKQANSCDPSLEKAVSIYREGISKLPADRQHLLWKKYLELLMNVLKGCRNDETVKFLGEAMDEAEIAKIKLDEAHYLAWMDCCGNNEALLIKRLEQGVTEHSKSVMLWSVYLKHYVFQDDWKMAKAVFRRAVIALGAKSEKIWELFLNFCILKAPVQEIDALYEEAINQPYPEISTIFKPRYLNWTIIGKGIGAARQLYLRLVERPPYCKKFHEEMYLAEHAERAPIKTNLNRVLDLWTKQFGTEDPFVYIHRLILVKDLDPPDLNEKILEIYEEGLKNLKGNKAELFQKQTALLEYI